MLKSESDDGVSPVIGVILMVAITVILAAVIGTFVLDLAGNTDQQPKAGFNYEETARQTDTEPPSGEINYEVKITIVNVTAGDEFVAEYMQYSEEDGDGDGDTDFWNATTETESTIGSSAGDSLTVDPQDVDDDITIIGVLEGERTVLQTYTVEGN